MLTPLKSSGGESERGSILRTVVEECVVRAVLVVRFVREGAQERDVAIDKSDIAPAQDFVVMPVSLLERLALAAGRFGDPAKHAEGIVVGHDDQARRTNL